MKHIQIYREKNRYVSFPHIAYLPNGSLAVTFRRASQFSAEAAIKGVATHHDPDSSIEQIISTDEGMTWKADSLTTVYKSKYGVNDPSITVLKDGTILNRYVALDIRSSREVKGRPSKIFSHRVEHGLVTTVVGNMISKSTDGGKSWEVFSVADVPEIGPSCSRDPILEMPDGSLLMPVYTGAPQRSDISWVIRSFDGGKTWCEPIRIMSDENGRFSQLHGVNYNETSLLHLGNGEVLAMVRADSSFHTEGELMPVGGAGSLCTARSYDGGLCWSLPQKTGIWGQPGSLMRLKNGHILCTYGYRRKPFGVRCALSKDNGATWLTSEEIVIRDDAPTWDVGYPFSIELKNGGLLTVYYFVDGEGVRHIAGTHWNLK